MHMELSFYYFGACILTGFGLGLGWHSATYLFGKIGAK